MKSTDLFQVLIESSDDTTEVLLAGELDRFTVPDLGAAVSRAWMTGTGTIVADLAQVTFIELSGVRALIDAAFESRQRGRVFTIRYPSATVSQVIRLLGVASLLPLEEGDHHGA